MTVTAETITNDQIKQLWHAGLIDIDVADRAFAINTRAVVLDRGYMVTPHDRQQARALCAEIFNARSAA